MCDVAEREGEPPPMLMYYLFYACEHEITTRENSSIKFVGSGEGVGRRKTASCKEWYAFDLEIIR